MIIKSIVVILVFYTSCITGEEYKYNLLAGGWLKYHEMASWEDANIQCDTEGAVLASPTNSQIRDGIQNYLKGISKTGATIHAGVQATPETGDYYSLDGVDLKKMPVLIMTESVQYSGTESCVKWMTGKAEVMYNNCQEKLPFVCLKKRKNLAIAGCGTLDPEYKYSENSGSCYKFHTKGLAWGKAYKQCKKEGGYLAICNSELEKRALIALYDKYPLSMMTDIKPGDSNQVFMGLRKWDKSEPWMTVKDQTLEESGFPGWAPNEPNNYLGNELCASMFRTGHFNDESCDDTLAYICEKQPEILYS